MIACTCIFAVSQTKFQVDLQERSYQQLEQVFSGTNISSGGVWFPSPVDWCPEGACNMSSLALTPELAIVIPVRDRDGHLRVLLHNLIRFLQRQRKSFRIFVVEQVWSVDQIQYSFNSYQKDKTCQAMDLCTSSLLQL